MDRHTIALQKLAAGTVIPATPLALTADKTLHEPGMRLLMNYYLDCGVGGIATGVHTTQFEIRDEPWRLYEPVLTIVSAEIDRYEQEHGTVTVKVAGVCGKTEQAVREAALAKSLGYDAVLLSPGGLAAMDEDYMIDRTKAVAAVMPVIGFYLQPAAGGRLFTYDYWCRLCAIPGVIAIKCAPFNRYQTLDVIRAVAMSDRTDAITLYTGNDDNIVLDLLMNYEFTKDGKTVRTACKGGLLGHWSVWTEKVVKMFGIITAAREKGEIPAQLLTLAAEVTDANSAFFDAAHGFRGSIAGLHEVLHRQGLMEFTHCLSEREVLSPGQEAEISRVLAAYPHLSDDGFVAENLPRWKARAGFGV